MDNWKDYYKILNMIFNVSLEENTKEYSEITKNNEQIYNQSNSKYQNAIVKEQFNEYAAQSIQIMNNLTKQYLLNKLSIKSFKEKIEEFEDIKFISFQSLNYNSKEEMLLKFKHAINIMKIAYNNDTAEYISNKKEYDDYITYILPIYIEEIKEKLPFDDLKLTYLKEYIKIVDSCTNNKMYNMHYAKDFKKIANELHLIIRKNLNLTVENCYSLKNRCDYYYDADITKTIPFFKILKHIIIKFLSLEQREYYYDELTIIEITFNYLNKNENKLFQLYENIGQNLMSYSDYQKEYEKISEILYQIKRFINKTKEREKIYYK